MSHCTGCLRYKGGCSVLGPLDDKKIEICKKGGYKDVRATRWWPVYGKVAPKPPAK